MNIIGPREKIYKQYTHNMEKQIKVGKVSDKMETLEKLCNKKAEQMSKTMNITGETVVTFWTGIIPELICVGIFKKGADGKVSFDLDFSQSTL